MNTPELGWNETIGSTIVAVTEHWVVAVVPMIYTDRLVLMDRDEWKTGYIAGWCFERGFAALAAHVWDPETEVNPLGYIKVACDSRNGSLL